MVGTFVIGRMSVSYDNIEIFRLFGGRSTIVEGNTNSITHNKNLEQEKDSRHSKHNKLTAYENINYVKWEDKVAVMKLKQMILNNVQKQIFFQRPFRV